MDPRRRVSPAEALLHPFFTGAPLASFALAAHPFRPALGAAASPPLAMRGQSQVAWMPARLGARQSPALTAPRLECAPPPPTPVPLGGSRVCCVAAVCPLPAALALAGAPAP